MRFSFPLVILMLLALFLFTTEAHSGTKGPGSKGPGSKGTGTKGLGTFWDLGPRHRHGRQHNNKQLRLIFRTVDHSRRPLRLIVRLGNVSRT